MTNLEIKVRAAVGINAGQDLQKEKGQPTEEVGAHDERNGERGLELRPELGDGRHLGSVLLAGDVVVLERNAHRLDLVGRRPRLHVQFGVDGAHHQAGQHEVQQGQRQRVRRRELCQALALVDGEVVCALQSGVRPRDRAVTERYGD